MFAFSAWRIASTVLLIILVFFGCSLFGLVQSNDLRDGYNDQFVPMVDPAGRDPERDLTFSQANKNNSEANLNNAEAVRSLAHATAIIRQSEYNDPLYVPKEVSQMQGDAFNRGMLFIVGCIVLFVFGYVIKAMFSGSGSHDENTNLSRR